MASEEWIYRFGDIEVEPAAHRIARGGNALNVEPKAFAVLVALLEQSGKALERDVLLDRVWGHRHVTPGVLNRVVAQLRKALGDDAEHPRYIQTLHSLGYRFIGEVERVAVGAGGAQEAEVPPLEPAAESATERAFENPHPHPHTRLRYFALASALALVALLFGLIWQRQDTYRPKATIAVLPFTSLSDDRRDRYFAEGLSVEMLDALAGVPGLHVAAWRPEAAIDRRQDVKALGKALGVATILDASVRRNGRRLRISARLSDTATGYTLWSRTYDREVDAVFDTQSRIAQEVAQALVGELPDAGRGLAKRLTPTRNVAAFDAYLQGIVQALHVGEPEAQARAAGHFREALAADAGFVRAQAGLCRTELWRYESERHADAFESARLACMKAADMDPGLGDVQLALGDLYRVSGDPERALRHYAASLGVPSLHSRALVGQARVHIDQGTIEQGLQQLRKAAVSDPANAEVLAELGYQQYRMGRYRDAIASYRRVVALSPNESAYWATYGGILLNAGEHAQAEAALKRSVSIAPNASSLANLGEIACHRGQFEAAVQLYRQATALDPGNFFLVGSLADALTADARTAPQARDAYARAAAQAQRLVDRKQDDPLAFAALGWYRANLGERDAALTSVARAEMLRGEPGEVALYNAQTFALLGEMDEARDRIDIARKIGVPESRIAASTVIRRAGLAGGQHAR